MKCYPGFDSDPDATDDQLLFVSSEFVVVLPLHGYR